MNSTRYAERELARRRLSMLSISATCLLIIGIAAACGSADTSAQPSPQSLVDRSSGLVVPGSVRVATTDTDQARNAVNVAQLLYTFWNSGNVSYLNRAVAQNFRDNTLPAGRPQGPTGPAAGSTTFRAAIPDLTCQLADLYVTGDTFTARLVFRGHFTGTYNGVRGTGQTIDFNAIDIQRIGAGNTIAEDWHLEDNLTFLKQAGLVTIAAR